MINSNCLMDHILYSIFQIILSISLKKGALLDRTTKALTDNPPLRMYANKIEKRITIKIKSRYCLEFLIPETMRLLEALKTR